MRSRMSAFVWFSDAGSDVVLARSGALLLRPTRGGTWHDSTVRNLLRRAG